MKKGKIRLASTMGMGVLVNATIFGDWAVHRGGAFDWRVSHVPSGMGAVDCLDYGAALSAARLLHEKNAGESLPSTLASVDDDGDWIGGALYSERDLSALDAARDLAWGYEVTP